MPLAVAVEALEVFRGAERVFGQGDRGLTAMPRHGSRVYSVCPGRLVAVWGRILVNKVVIRGFGVVVACGGGVYGGGILGVRWVVWRVGGHG